MSTGKPFYFKADSYTSNDVLSTAYNTAVIEGRDVLPPQLPDSLSKYKSNDCSLCTPFKKVHIFRKNIIIHTKFYFREYNSIYYLGGCLQRPRIVSIDQ